MPNPLGLIDDADKLEEEVHPFLAPSKSFLAPSK
jgi:hypothetical protein